MTPAEVIADLLDVQFDEFQSIAINEMARDLSDVPLIWPTTPEHERQMVELGAIVSEVWRP